MPKAKSLADLLKIREANSTRIDQIDEHLGSALGFKITQGVVTNEPAVIIFVPAKVPNVLLPASQQIPKTLKGPGGLTCPTDVVVGKKALTEPPSAPLTPANQQIVNDLTSGAINIIGGIQLGFFENDGKAYVGTAACLVKRKTDGKLGLLTNQHVGGAAGRPMYHPEPGRFRIGFTRDSYEYEPDEVYFNGIIDETDAYYRIDCAYIELSDSAASIAKPGLYKVGSIGAPIPLDLNTMGPITRKVISIGRTRGIQKGTIMAFAYEWYDQQDSMYTDYLIIGEDGEVFSDHGDSGKLIVTDDDKRNAVALLWGGWFERLRNGHGQENWTYAIDINKVLAKLQLDIL